MEKILITDLIRLEITNYFSFKSYATVQKIEEKETDPTRCYVKIKINLDYYIHDENYKVIDIDFKNSTINGFLNLNKINL